VKILMDLDKETLQKYSERSGIPFDTIQPLEQAVVVLLPDSPKLEEVFNLNMPTAVIAGDITSKTKEAAHEIGYPDEAIIVKDNDTFRTLSGTPLFRGKNIPLSKIVTIANYIYENDILPEIIVWSPGKETTAANVPKEDMKDPGEKVIYKEPVRMAPTDRKPNIINVPISVIADKAKTNIYLIKTISEAQSGDIAYAISRKLGGLHIDITGCLPNINYGPDKISALSTEKYGYSSDGIKVEVAEAQIDTVVYEIDADFIDSNLLQKLYDKANKVYQIPSSFIRSVDSIQAWISAQFRLDGIIVTEDDEEFRREWPNLTFTLDQVLV
jgi:hypothetical protein